MAKRITKKTTPVVDNTNVAQESSPVVDNTNVAQESLSASDILAATTVNSETSVSNRRPVLFLICTGQIPPTVALSMALWEKMCPDADIRVIEANDYRSALVEFIADDESSESAVFVPVLTIPVSPISVADLEVLKSFTLNGDRGRELDALNTATKGMYKMVGKSDYIPRELPIVYDKTKLAELLAKFDISDDSVNIPTLYAAFVNRSVPFDASVVGGKITGLVARANPNMDVVTDYIRERKFVVTTAEGFEAIKPKLGKLLL